MYTVLLKHVVVFATTKSMVLNVLYSILFNGVCVRACVCDACPHSWSRFHFCHIFIYAPQCPTPSSNKTLFTSYGVCVYCFFHLLGLLPSAVPQAATDVFFFHLLGLLPSTAPQVATECFSRLLLSQCMKGREDEML